MQRDVDVHAFRFIVRLLLLTSIGLVVAGLYSVLQGHPWVGLAFIALGVFDLWLPQWFRLRPEPGAENLLFLLTKPDCPLCDEARLVVRPLLDGTPFTLQEIDIEDDRRLRRRFKNVIPVLLWQGEELGRLRIDPQTVRVRLELILEQRGLPVPDAPRPERAEPS